MDSADHKEVGAGVEEEGQAEKETDTGILLVVWTHVHAIQINGLDFFKAPK